MNKVSKKSIFIVLFFLAIYSMYHFGSFKTISVQNKFDQLIFDLEDINPEISYKETFNSNGSILSIEDKSNLLNLLKSVNHPWHKEKKLYDINIRYIVHFEENDLIIDTFQDISSSSLNGIVRFEDKGYSFYIEDDQGFTYKRYKSIK